MNPFFNSDGSRVSFSDVIQNVMLFIPLGLLGGVWAKQKNFSAISGFVIITVYGAFLSASVEIIQLYSISRTTSLNDLLTNTTGTLIGLLGSTISIKVIENVRKIRVISDLVGVTAFYSFLMLSIVIAIEVLQPFDFAIDPSMTFAKIKSLLANPLTVSMSIRDDVWVVTLYLTFGFLGAKIVESPLSQLVKKSIVMFSLFYPCLLEITQFIISSRSPQFVDIGIAITGILCGMIFFKAVSSKSTSGFRVLIPLYIVSLICKLWYPFKINAYYTPMNFVPFSAEYANTTMTSLGNSFETLVLYSFGGYLTASLLNVSKIHSVLLMTVVTLILTSILEYTQGWIIGRYPDISDVITSTSALLLGWLLYQNRFKKNVLE